MQLPTGGDFHLRLYLRSIASCGNLTPKQPDFGFWRQRKLNQRTRDLFVLAQVRIVYATDGPKFIIQIYLQYLLFVNLMFSKTLNMIFIQLFHQHLHDYQRIHVIRHLADTMRFAARSTTEPFANVSQITTETHTKLVILYIVNTQINLLCYQYYSSTVQQVLFINIKYINKITIYITLVNLFINNNSVWIFFLI